LETVIALRYLRDPASHVTVENRVRFISADKRVIFITTARNDDGREVRLEGTSVFKTTVYDEKTGGGGGSNAVFSALRRAPFFVKSKVERM